MHSSSITTSEAAAILGVSRQGVRYFVERGVLVPVDRIGPKGQFVFDRAAVEALAEERAA